MNSKTEKIVKSAMMAALCCVATMIIKIPSPLKGYLNLGDSIVLLAGFTLSPLQCFLASGLGSALADIFSGYAVYAPATFIIKGVMSVVACMGYKLLKKKTGKTFSRVISGIVSEIIMVLGYFLFEGLMYGFGPSVINIPANSIQGVAGLIMGVILAGIFDRRNN